MNLGRNKGKLFVISGPSGAGKGTIKDRLLKETNMTFSVSMTTRAPRQGEVEGEHYFFVTPEKFRETIENGGFLEHAEIYGNSYGTPKQAVLDRLEKGINVLLDIEMQGAMQVKQNFPDAVFIFILPPSLSELRRRLIGRGTETPEAVELRLSGTLDEMKYIDYYEYLVVNDDLEKAYNDVLSIVTAENLEIEIPAAEIIAKYKEEN